MVISDKKLVSIIIPTFNREECISRAIKSVILQTYQNFELLIIDNNSIDETDNIIASFQDDRIKVHKIDNGGVISKSRNKGILLAKGEFISFLDSDDWWTPDKLSICMDKLDSGVDIVYHDLYLMSNTRKKILKKVQPPRKLVSPIFEDLLFNGNALITSSVVMRKGILKKVQGFSNSSELIAAEDYDLWLRISRVTERFSRIQKVLGFYWHGEGNTTSPDKTIKNLNYLRKLYHRELNNKLPSWMAYELSRAYYKRGLMKQSYFYAKKSFKIKQKFINNIKSFYTLLIARMHLQLKNKTF